jgi:hypothetical protein
MNRLARNMTGLHKFEAYRLQGLMRAYEDLRGSQESLQQNLDQLHRERSHLSVRIALRLAHNVNRRPKLRKPLRKLILLVESALARVLA